jgi:hypothetical protein
VAGGTQGHNRYSYCLNNPLKYTDPSGYFLKAAMGMVSFLGEFASNLACGKSDALGKAYRQSSAATEEMGNALQFPIYSDDNTRVTAGIDIYNIGLSANAYHTSGDFAFSGSVGYGYASGGAFAGLGASYQTGDWTFSLGGGTNFRTYNVSGGVGYNDGMFNASYYQTYYGGSKDPALNQWNGGFTIGYGDFKIREENDFLAFGHTSDKGRTQALEISYGNWAIGSYVETNDPQNDKRDIDPKGRPSPHWGYNRSKKGFTSWANGQVLTAPVYLGYNSTGTVSRIGFSSWQVQDIQQNWMHQTPLWRAGNQNYYLDYNNLYTGPYLYYGYYNHFSHYGF